MFAKHFAGGGYVSPGDTIETQDGPFRIVARIEHDDHASPDDWSEEPTSEIIEAWYRDEWFYCGIVLSVYVGDVLLTDHAASLWGIEANYPQQDEKTNPNAYLLEVANDLLPEALQEARRIMDKLIGSYTK